MPLGYDTPLDENGMNLSGGQRQRVALGRAMVRNPCAFLLDEPLSNLDAKLRTQMRSQIALLHKRLETTFIYVTHDQTEAMTMADRIVVMKDGYIQQIGTPEDIYNEPVNKFVADFIGESNILDGIMLNDYKCSVNDIEYECVDKGFALNEKVDIVIRPEDLIITDESVSQIKGLVTDVVFKGVHYEIIVVDDYDGKEWMIHSIYNADVDSKVGLKFDPEAIHIMRKEVE